MGVRVGAQIRRWALWATRSLNSGLEISLRS